MKRKKLMAKSKTQIIIELRDEVSKLLEEIKGLKRDIKVISECKIHCKNCNTRIENALKGQHE